MSYSIIRSDRFGVYFAEVKEQTETKIVLKNARNIHYWEGAASVLQIANDPTKLKSSTRITVSVDELSITDNVMVIPCTEVAEKFLKEFPVWKI
jgi:hypothetical protein